MTHKRFSASFRYAWAGIRHAFAAQPNFRRELLLGALALTLAAWLRAPLAPSSTVPPWTSSPSA